MQRFRAILDRTLAWLLVTLMAASVVNVLWQVASRYLLRSPSSFTEELARYLLIWVGLLGAGYAAGGNLHLSIDLLPQALKGRGRAWLQIAIELSVLAFAGLVLIYGGARLVLLELALGQKSAAMGLEVGWVYLALPVSGAVMALYGVMNIARQVGGWRPARGPTGAPAGEGGAHGGH